MERHNSGCELFRLVNAYLKENGLKLNRGTIVNATIIDAPRSTRNKARQRDPEMASACKGRQWYFGMQAHIGVDSQSRLIHAVRVTPARVHDSQGVGDVLHSDERRVYSDSAYTGQKAGIRETAPEVKDFTHQPGRRHHPLTEKARQTNRTKSRIRARVERLFGVMKHQLGYRKVRYKGLEKTHQLFLLSVPCSIYLLPRSIYWSSNKQRMPAIDTVNFSV